MSLRKGKPHTYVCEVCGYVSDGILPDECPVCGVGKEKFAGFE